MKTLQPQRVLAVENQQVLFLQVGAGAEGVEVGVRLGSGAAQSARRLCYQEAAGRRQLLEADYLHSRRWSAEFEVFLLLNIQRLASSLPSACLDA